MRITHIITRYLAITLLAFTSWTLNASLPPNTKPIDPALFKNGLLQLTGGNCQIPTPPGSGWRWYEVMQTETPSFICTNTDTQQTFIITTQDFAATHISDLYIKGIFSGIEKTLNAAGKQFERLNAPLPSLPNKEAVGFSYSMKDRNGLELYSYGYAIPTGSICMIQAITLENKPPDYFLSVAGAIEPIKQKGLDEIFPIIRLTASWFTYLLIGGVAWLIAEAVNLKRSSVNMRNPWSVVGLSILFVASTNLFLFSRSKVFNNMTHLQHSEALGMVSAAPIVLLLILIWPWLRFRKQKFMLPGHDV